MANIIFSQATGVNDSVFGKSQAPIVAFIESYAEAFEKKSISNVLFKKKPSKNFAEKYASMTAMRGIQPVGENGAPPIDGNREGYSKTVEPMVWKDRFAISREIIDDAKLMDLKRQPAAFTAAHHRVLEDFGAAIFGGALSGNTYITYGGMRFPTTSIDGVSAFSSSHPSITNALYTQSNLFGNTITADAIGRMETAMQQFTDDDGNILNIAPDTIIIPNDADMKNAVFTALGSDQKPGSSDNDWNYQVGRWNVIVWPYLNKHVKGQGRPWFMWDSEFGNVYDDMVWQERIPLSVTSYLDHSTHANVWDAYHRFTMEFVDWRALCAGGVQGAAEMPDSPVFPVPNIRTVLLSATVAGDSEPPVDGDKLTASGVFSDGGTGADGTITYQWENLSGSTWSNASTWTGHNTATITTVATTDDGESFRCKVTYTDANGASSVYTPTVVLA